MGEQNGARTQGSPATADASNPLVQRVASLCDETLPRLNVRGVTGMCISRCLDGEMSGLVYASDPLALQLEELQTTLTESPAQYALRTRGPVLISDLRTAPLASWMSFSAEAQRLGVQSVYAVPLQIGVVVLGMLTLHGTGSIQLDAALTREAFRLADKLQVALLGSAGTDYEAPGWADGLLSEGHIVTHQAAGMVMVQARGTLKDALVMIHAAAFSSGCSVREVARRVVARELTFAPPDGPTPLPPEA